MTRPPPFVNTNIEDWKKSEEYHAERLIPKDPVLEEALKNSQENGLPGIQVSPTIGKYLQLVAQSIRARRILEVGTLGGHVFTSFKRQMQRNLSAMQ